MSIADLIDEIFRLYRQNFGLLFGIAALVSIPATIAFAVGTSFLGPFEPAEIEVFTPADAANVVAAGVALVLGGLLFLVTFPLLVAAITDATAKRYLGRLTTIGASLRVGMARYWRVLVGYLLVLLAVLGISLLAIVGFFASVSMMVDGSGALVAAGVIGLLVVFVAWMAALVWLTVTWTFLPQAVVLEDIGAVAALARSARLVAGSRWRVIGINLLLTIIGVILLSLPSSLIGLIVQPLPLPFNLGLAISQLVAALAGIAFYPIQLGTVALLYYDLRVRKEGFDLALAAERLPAQ
jgi:hypothetical protein